MEHEGHRQRLRNRFLSGDLSSFAPHEVLELLLTYAIPRRDTNPIAHKLMDTFGSFHAVLEAPVEELKRVEGIGQNAALLLNLLLPIQRLYEKDKLGKRLSLKTFNEVAQYCVSLVKGIRIERFYVLCFDSRLQLISCQLIAEGTLNEVAVYPRRVLSALLIHNASGAVLCHNHPGGSPTPSNEDIELTQMVNTLLSGVSIRLYDHILVTGTDAFSFHRHGLLGNDAPQSLSLDSAFIAEKERLTDKPKGR